jgi:hypothetical protein
VSSTNTKDNRDTTSVDLHIKSKDVSSAELILAIAPMLTALADTLDIEIEYIGREEKGKLHSLLGPPEVRGDILELCANAVGGRAAQLDFVACLSKDWRNIPGNWEPCAETAKIDVEKIRSCADGKAGRELLRASFRRSAARGLTRGPAVFINNAPYNGLPTEPSLGRAICHAIKEDKPPYCDNVPSPVRVPITIVEDKRCRHRSCSTERIKETFAKFVEGAEIEALDYADPRGKAAFRRTNRKYLPLVIVSAEVKKDKRGLKKIGGYLKRIEASEDFVYPMGDVWDPTQEICDDTKDNDGNGKVDCEDERCRGRRGCRDEIQRSIVLFGMSHCSYAARAVVAAHALLESFGNNREKIDFRLAFVGKAQDGELTSLHGAVETQEELRQVCAQKYYAKEYAFMAYTVCRADMFLKSKGQEPRDVNWAYCAKKPIKADVIRRCAEGEEGKALLAASYKEATKLEMSGAPRWLLNNQTEVVPKSADGIKAAFCEMNSGLSECETTLSKTETMRDYCGGRPLLR